MRACYRVWAGSIRQRIPSAPSRNCASARIENFNLDLMYALPSQTLEEALRDVRKACSLGPAHISYYQLTLEVGTVFHSRPPPLPDEETAWLIQTEGKRLLAEAGFEQYEVSAYAKDGARCRHNLNYWLFGDYIGIGAGAHGKVSIAAPERILRTVKPKQPGEYQAQANRGRGIESIGDCRRASARFAVRIHVECAALERRLQQRLLRKAHGPAACKAVRTQLEQAASARLARRTSARRLAADRPGEALPQRSAGCFSALSLYTWDDCSVREVRPTAHCIYIT
jgi:coproporphyrinogen III oxidase-like Fe-S oxidoreductase